MTLTLSAMLIVGLVILYAILISIFSFLFRITGLTGEKSLFQAISLLTSCGFTTKESEVIAGNRTRRHIAIFAMITGYSFSVIIVSLIINFMMNISPSTIEDSLIPVICVFGAFVLFLILLYIPPVHKLIDKVTAKMAKRIMRKKQDKNIITVLDEYGKDSLCEVLINQMPEPLKEKTVFESKLKQLYRMNVVTINRKGRTLDVQKDTMLTVGDIIVVFGSYQNIKDLFTVGKDQIEKVLDKEDLSDNIINLMENFKSNAMAEITINRIPEFMKGKTLIDSGLKSEYGINVAFIQREDRHVPVTKDTVVQEGDVLVVFGPYKNIKEAFLYNELNK